MRLLETSSADIPRMREFIGPQIPPYAILSHTWEDEEVTMQQLIAGTADLGGLQAKAGFRKIHRTCEVARTRDRLEYVWVDTCCIDKTSSAELTEAINSMFAWYRDAEVCYVFLADLEPGSDEDLEVALPRCRWFTRGWTLQELIAPREVVFFDKRWNNRGTKKHLTGLLNSITGIPEGLLSQDAELCDFPVARRMSWAARRQTTRVEDMAYCLLGIFDVSMPFIYGDGMKVFQRLQTKIIETTLDLSILAWTDARDSCPPFSGVLAESPSQFSQCGNIELGHGDSAYVNFAITASGIVTDASLIHHDYQLMKHNYERDKTNPEYHRSCACHEVDARFPVVLNLFCDLHGKTLGIGLRKIGGGLYARYKPNTVLTLGRPPERCPLARYSKRLVETLTLVMKLPRPALCGSRGLDPAVRNRISVLRVDWGPLVILDFRVRPQSHWDIHDGVFFNCNAPTIGWGAWFVRAELPQDRNSLYVAGSVHFFLACFDWRGQPIVCMADLDKVDSAKTVLLESQLNQLKFEMNRQAYTMVRSVLADQLRESRGSPTMQCDFGATEVKVTSSVSKESRPDLCVNPVLVLNIENKVAATPEIEYRESRARIQGYEETCGTVPGIQLTSGRL
ncbi:heterokaryon incompatibility protein-domain-containing protein [Chaetomium strumarium]|uniref:Heterokaryon incompatibility protein-domain-containing protein n=1 Tax=Chaetomium strumarium TaxID=1170767 RepID=A0AAJ0GSH0_9PEZI|nr:heterokaryon incompatibility protein-domain-containing protein [Chaetomium strumarium]